MTGQIILSRRAAWCLRIEPGGAAVLATLTRSSERDGTVTWGARGSTAWMALARLALRMATEAM